jgi:hypothetical protein
MAGEPFKLVYPDGKEYLGVLDAEGCAELMIEGAPEVEFPGMGEVQPC